MIDSHGSWMGWLRLHIRDRQRGDHKMKRNQKRFTWAGIMMEFLCDWLDGEEGWIGGLA
jgi:hypothetical protein